MEGLADFLDSLIGGVDFVMFCALIGGLIWVHTILRPWQTTHHYSKALLDNTTQLIYYGTIGLAITQAFALLLKVWLMAATLQQWPFPAFAGTLQFQAGLARLLLVIVLAYFIKLRLTDNPQSHELWKTAAWGAVPIIIAGAWLTHGAGRFDYRLLLMTSTVIHQVAAACWVGGIFQLLVVWHTHRQGQAAFTLWPAVLRQFSKVGLTAVAVLALTGLPMAINFIDSINGLIGSGYGNLLMVKLMLLGLALAMAYLNRKGTLEFFQQQRSTLAFREVPNFIQAETFVLVSLVFTAVSLATQPPAIDIPDTTASWQEVIATFKPRVPMVISPTHEELMAGEAGRTAIIGQVPSRAMTDWSDYNHNMAGIFVAAAALLSLAGYFRTNSLSPRWPLVLAALGLFLFIRSDPETWPMGPIGFWESTLNSGEILQHRIATLLAFFMGVMEYRARSQQQANPKLIYLFPFLAAFGGLMLLTHSHVGFQPKTAFLIQAGHTLMGFFAIILACARWLELKLSDPAQQRIAGIIAGIAMLQIGMILMFYQEPLY
ncbi:MAG: CopD family protein [Methylococcales bacterium]|nr:CopD family protein [Methylococcales bacterium]